MLRIKYKGQDVGVPFPSTARTEGLSRSKLHHPALL
jgi:hypothetical protein